MQLSDVWPVRDKRDYRDERDERLLRRVAEPATFGHAVFDDGRGLVRGPGLLDEFFVVFAHVGILVERLEAVSCLLPPP